MKLLIWPFLILGYHALLGQSIDLLEVEHKLATFHNQLTHSKSDAQKDSLSEAMRLVFIESFSAQETFSYPFDRLKFSKLTSSDGRVRLFNWNLPYEDGTHKYFCFVLVREDKKSGYWWRELKDNPNEVDKIENKILPEEKWLGALYYEIIPIGKKSVDTYTLLGWDGKDRMTTRKIIDVLTISGKKIKMGAGIFNSDQVARKRFIFEYSEEVSTSVKYYPKKNCIVMDHLSPKNPMMTGVYADYGPDGSYDMLVLNKNYKWDWLENIDIQEFTKDDGKPFYDPRSRQRRK